MQINHADITISAVSPEQYPKDSLPEIAIAGRSNVGKSSFINSMLNRKNLARTSSKPGKTRTINFFIINEQFYFVDVPGYGYAKVSKTERQKWSDMMEEYFSSREELAFAILIVDARHEPTDSDRQMYEYFKFFDIPVLVIGTKIDKLKKSQRAARKDVIARVLELAPEDDVILYSSETKQGRDDVWNVIKGAL